ncbi:MAG TPA: DUF4920 domain-containing protein [Polyangiaceae bacterium]|nr:DUF4920 domain-containing protein [Polyangiaceae bacterium]
MRRFSFWSAGGPAGAISILPFLLASAACESGHANPPSAPATEPGAAKPAADSPAAPSGAPAGGTVSHYGGTLEPASSVPLTNLLQDPKAYAEQTVTTEGKVQRACSRKGCWMEIGSGEDACRVTFKDYGFFVPTDSAGAYAKIQGRLDTREVEAAAVQHLESEGARFRNKKPDGSATEVRLIASAVELTR